MNETLMLEGSLEKTELVNIKLAIIIIVYHANKAVYDTHI